MKIDILYIFELEEYNSIYKMELLAFDSDEMKEFKAAFFGGIAESIVGQPFDTVRVRQQTQHGTAPQYKNMIHAFSDIIDKEKVHGLYKGVTSLLVGVLFTNTLTFGVQGNVQKHSWVNGHLLNHAFAGFIAGLVASTVRSPIELFRIRIQTQGQGQNHVEYKASRLYSSPFDCMGQVVRNEGISGVYRGFTLTAARESTSCAVYFLTYEGMCGMLQPGVKSNDRHTRYVLVAGGTAGVMSWLVNYPVDVVKSKVQADVDHRYKGNVDCWRKTWQEDGVRGFSKGLSTTLLRAFVVHAAIFYSVATAKQYMA